MNIHMRLKNLERRVRDDGYSPGTCILLRKGDEWELTFNMCNGSPDVRQITSTHVTEDEAHAEFEKLCKKHRRRDAELTMIIVDV